MRTELDAALKQLQEALENIDQLDGQQADQLRGAAKQITETLDHSDVDSASLAKRLQEQTDAFQESHPTLTDTVGRIADILQQMGI